MPGLKHFKDSDFGKVRGAVCQPFSYRVTLSLGLLSTVQLQTTVGNEVRKER